MMIAATLLRQLLWIYLISRARVHARINVTSQEKHSYYVNPHYPLCENIQCLRVEDVFMSTTELRERPCDNYFGFACHKNYTGNYDHPPFRQDNANRVMQQLREILQQTGPVKELDMGNRALELEQKVFKQCQNYREERYETIMRSKPADRLLLRDNAYDNAYRASTHLDWRDADLSYALQGFGFAFFDVDVVDRSFEFNHSSARRIRIQPPSYAVSKLTRLLGERFNNKNADLYIPPDKYEKLQTFIDIIHDITVKEGERGTSNGLNGTIRDWDDEYNRHAFYPSAKINWLNHLSKLFNKARVTVDDMTPVEVENKDYFKKLAEKLTPQHVDTIGDFVHFHFVSKTIGLVESQYSKLSILPQIKGLPCTPGILAGTAYKYADENFPQANRGLLEELIAKVKEIVVARVDMYSHHIYDREVRKMMSDFVREYASAKIYVGYPNWLMKGTAAYRIYGNDQINIGVRLYDNQAMLIEQIMKTKLSALDKPDMPIIDLTEFHKVFKSSQITVRSMDSEAAEITVPFGYFNEKDYRFFSAQLFDPINYGAVATEIAFKLYYYLLEKMSYHAIAPRCVREQVPGHIRDRSLFMKKAAAYSLALDAAYESWPSQNSLPIQFVDFGAIASNDLFFLSFAQSLCSIPRQIIGNPTDDAASDQHEDSYRSNDYDSLSHYINFTLQNSQPFLDNYNCKRHETMYRARLCDPLTFD